MAIEFPTNCYYSISYTTYGHLHSPSFVLHELSLHVASHSLQPLLICGTGVYFARLGVWGVSSGEDEPK